MRLRHESIFDPHNWAGRFFRHNTKCDRGCEMNDLPTKQRVVSALKSAFIGDALAMPVHWYYNPMDIFRQFPGGISKFEDAPDYHPSSIMSLHSTRTGGRESRATTSKKQEIVGELILKGRKEFWGNANQHYHHGMLAGENTLNAYCCRAMLRVLAESRGHYHRDSFLDAYIELMTAEPPQHPDTYAESYHRGFFANLSEGRPAHECGAVTHDTASIGGLVTIAPIVFAERLSGTPLEQVIRICLDHLALTHPDKYLAKVCRDYICMLNDLLFRDPKSDARALINEWSKRSISLPLSEISPRICSDNDVVGGMFSSACYITDSWPCTLYLAYKYCDTQESGLLANTNLGGDNVHRGSILGTLLGLSRGETIDDLFTNLRHNGEIQREIDDLLLALNSA